MKLNNNVIAAAAIVLIAWIIGMLHFGCIDPAIQERYNADVAGCYDTYGQRDSGECIAKVNARYHREEN